MRDAPPKYPGIPHLVPGPGVGADDLVLDPAGRERLLAVPLVVEEKLDGANVTIWLQNRAPRVATRGGPDAIDRGGQRGRLKAWASERADGLRDVLGDRYALFGEWLLRRHTVPYDRLPGPLVGLDLYDRIECRFLDVASRDVLLEQASVPSPPRLYEGQVATVEAASKLLGPSAFGATPAEGIVLRASRPRDGRLLAKLVDPSWSRLPDAGWARPAAANVVAP